MPLKQTSSEKTATKGRGSGKKKALPKRNTLAGMINNNRLTFEERWASEMNTADEKLVEEAKNKRADDLANGNDFAGMYILNIFNIKMAK